MLPNIENHFSNYFPLHNQTLKFYFPFGNSLSPAFILHSKFDLQWTKRSLSVQSKGIEFGSCLQIYLPKRRIQHVMILMIGVSLKFHQRILYISQLISQIFIQYFI